MHLKKLKKLIESLQIRIKEEGDEFKRNEAKTRFALIDPILNKLGWNPIHVKIEYQIENGDYIDYALINKHTKVPLVFIEVKKMSSSLKKAVGKLFFDSIENDVRHFAVSNGSLWEIYEISDNGKKNKLTSFNLETEQASVICMKALSLWRHNVYTGYIRPASQFTEFTAQIPTHKINTADDNTSVHTFPDISEQLTDTNNVWENLTNFEVIHNTPPPRLIKLPDKTQKPIAYWNEVMTETVRWLSNNGRLTTEHCPIQTPFSAAKPLVSTTHTDGKSVEQFFVNVNFNASSLVKHTKYILELLGENSNEFYLLTKQVIKQSLIEITDTDIGTNIPVIINFPNGEQAVINSWRSLIRETVIWLQNQNLLTPEKCPINSKLENAPPIISTTPISDSFIPIGEFYVKHTGGRRQIISNTISLLEKMEQDTSKFFLEIVDFS